MRVMVLVKASAGDRGGRDAPSQELLAEMGKFNEELVKAGVMLAGDGLQPSSQGTRVRFDGDRAHGDRRAVRRDQGARRRLLDLAGQVDGRGRRVGQALLRSDGAREVEIRPVFEAEDFGEAVHAGAARAGGRGCAPSRRSSVSSTHDATVRRTGGRRAPIEAVWRIESARLIAGAGADRARRRRGRGPRAGRAGRGARAVARVGRPGQPGRLADGHGQAPGDRPLAPARACSSASTQELGRELGARQDADAPDLSRGARRRDRRRPAAADLHRLPSGAVDRGAGGADAAAARRADHRRDRAGLPGPRADGRAADRAGEADARRGAGAVRGAGRRRARRRGWPRCSR